jgi:putative membrane protein
MAFLNDWYLWTKTLHVISVIAWMAGLFYLPRLFVYHVERGNDGAVLLDTLAVMERRLLHGIMNPAAISSWIFGLALVATPGVVSWDQIWPWTKLVSILGMTAFHLWLAACRIKLLQGNNTVSGRSYRLMNEVPTVLLIVIIASVIVKF